MNSTYLIPKTTVSPTYCIYAPDSPVPLDIQGTLLSINVDKLSRNSNSCTVSISINEDMQNMLRDLYSSFLLADSSITFNDTIVSPYVQGSFLLDRVVCPNGDPLTPSTLTDVLNKPVQAQIELIAIHRVARQGSEKKFPVFVISTLAFV